MDKDFSQAIKKTEQDITDLKKIQTELNKLKKQMDQLLEAMNKGSRRLPYDND